MLRLGRHGVELRFEKDQTGRILERLRGRIRSQVPTTQAAALAVSIESCGQPDVRITAASDSA